MCLIIYCPSGSNKESDFVKEAMKTAFDFNKDGIGYAIKRPDKSVFISKGFFDLDTLTNHLEVENVSIEDELMLHFRIGNKGVVNKDMSHPFVVSEVPEEIIADELFTTKPILAHNGTMNLHSVAKSEFSDTYFFIKNVLSKELILDLLSKDLDLFQVVMAPHLNLSRLCIMFPDERDTILLGNWFKYEDVYLSKDYKKEYFTQKQTIGFRTIDYYDDPNLFSLPSGKRYDKYDDSGLDDFPWDNEKSDIIPNSIPMYKRRSFKVSSYKDVYHEYMGLLLPTSDLAIKQGEKYIVSLDNDNYSLFDVICTESDYEIGVYSRYSYYIIGVSQFYIRLYCSEESSPVDVPVDKFYELFYIENSDEDITDFYESYYKLVSKCFASKTSCKAIEKMISSSKKDMFCFKGVKGLDRSVLELFVKKAEEEIDFVKLNSSISI